MSFFQNLFKPAAPKPPPPLQPPPVPLALPKITAPTAAQIAQTSNPSPAALELLTPQQTPAEYLQVLQDQQMGDEMVKTMAHGMPDQEGVMWASQSAEQVSGQLPPEEVNALKAAQAWAKSPTPANQAAAATAAAQTNYQGPGAWAAQGAAWSQPAVAAPTVPGVAAPAVPAAALPRMTPHAVAGAVLLASAIKANPAMAAPKMPSLQAPTLAAPVPPELAANIPQAPAVVPPAVKAQVFRQQHPFIASGLDIASGKTPMA